MSRPDFVVVGHVVRDVVSEGWRLGGTATFAAIQATRLGVRTGVVTRVSSEIDLASTLPGIEVAGRPSAVSTSFENVYDGASRRQRVPVQADPVELEDVPGDWLEAPMALLGPVCGELGAGLAERFSGPLVAVAGQGWLRELDESRQVQPRSWSGEPFWRGATVAFVSNEDLAGDERPLQRWPAEVPVVAVTAADRGATIIEGDTRRSIAAFPAKDVDPTGAGDVFAAAFLVRYHETESTEESARFASAAAACSVEATGADGIARRDEIERRMGEQPEIVLR